MYLAIVCAICSNKKVNSWLYEFVNFTETEGELLYDVVEIGDYIQYTGNNGCTGNQCSGWNANQTGTDLYEKYGYYKDRSKFCCGNEENKAQ
mgnify:CR=1 FL=1